MFDKQQKIPISCDHGGFDMKEFLKIKLEKLGYIINDMGTYSVDSVDYPDFIHPLAKAVNDGEVSLGILICGSANGVAMTANKYPNVRAGLCWNKEIVSLIRQHNDANILCIPARFTSIPQAVAMVRTFLNTSFEGGRHQARVDKIGCS